MMHYEALLQLTHDRCERLQREAEAERLALQARGQRQRRRRRGWHCTPRARRRAPKPMAERTRPPRA